MINNLSNNLDVICVEGQRREPETLTEAGAADADLIMAAMRSDEMNMVCGISARKLGTKHVIARIRDTGYMKQTEFLREALGLSVIVNPELECAKGDIPHPPLPERDKGRRLFQGQRRDNRAPHTAGQQA